jgi:hypothetical protein
MMMSTSYYEIISHLKSQYFATPELWAVTAYANEYGLIGDYKPHCKRVDLFCEVVKAMLARHDIRIAKDGLFLERSPEEIADRFKLAFPQTSEEMLEKDAYWWFLDDCPGGFVWYTDIGDNGFETSPVGDGRFYLWT